ncbi:hypothetical protein LCGC14_1367110 [marine sediment metagenome]|uniref:Uncharacterized protein n=1 Tax=marine sediment metagenome TaxID=412755 RepID=A0A0F9K6U3_9ZZZZ
MATVINTFPDRRAELLGKGLGGLIGNVITARQKAREEERKKEALKNVANLIQQSMGGGRTQKIPLQERSSKALAGGKGPTKTAAKRLEAEPKTRKVPVQGSEIVSGLQEAGIEGKFAITLMQGIEAEKIKREEEEQQSAAIGNALKTAVVGGASRRDLVGGIAENPDLTAAQKISLFGQLNNFLPADEDETTIKVFGPDTDEATVVPVTKKVAGNLKLREAFIAKNFPGFSTTAPAAAPSEGRIKETGIKGLLAANLIDENMANKLRAGVLEARGPDAEGRVAIIDKSQIPPHVNFIGGGVSLRVLDLIDRRRLAIGETLTLLKSADTSSVGIVNILKREVGGIALQIPIVGAIVRAMGLEEEEVAKLQTDSSGFFAILTPLAISFRPGGSRAGAGTDAQIKLAERVLNMTRFSSMEAGAEQTKQSLISILEELRDTLTAQRLSRDLNPVVHKVRYFFDDNGKLQAEILK